MNWHGIISRLLAKTGRLFPAQWRLPIRYHALIHSPDVEPELLQLFSLCDQFRCAIDVGCSHGYYAYKMAHRFEQVFAFDANSTADLDIRYFRRNNLHYFPFGLSDKTATRILKIPVRRGVPYIGWASLADRELSFAESYKTAPVAVQRLDDQSFAMQAKIDLIKIDVEGYELEVILGGMELIRRNRPVIILEDNPGQRKAIQSTLQSLGYTKSTLSQILGTRLPSPNLIYLPT